ncbi:hypothetical protein J3R82DRAFT_8005 [Butyriboletus roseoflavus]|nr:hypothetical protein J3R82DRAFT_8005 [Butyriboletus roseoflavus]
MDEEPRQTSPAPEFDVRAKIDEFSTMLSRTIICFYQFLASDSESEGPRRRLLDEYITVGGAANSTKILLDTSDERKAEGYLERRKKIESLWFHPGPLAQFASHMENAYNIMSTAIKDHRKVATPTRKRGPFPLSLEMLNEENRLIQEYKQQTADTLYDDFYRSTKERANGFSTRMFASVIMIGGRPRKGSFGFVVKACCGSSPDTTQTLTMTQPPLASLSFSAIVDQIFKELWEKIQEQEKQDGYKREYDEPPYILPEFFPAFYFFDFRDTRTLETSTFLKSLFVQFLQVPQPDLAVTFPDLTKQHFVGLPPPTDTEALQDLVLHAMRSHKKRTTFVDGLNECDDVPAVMTFLERAMQEANIRILVASRPDPDILAKYRG